jgi:hypothetical protein
MHNATQFSMDDINKNSGPFQFEGSGTNTELKD